ncbi:MAG: hypothetical protein RLZZ243_644 [Bacteroidota bacterium]|jgi:hypothetical protein
MKWIKRFFLLILTLVAVFLLIGVFAPKKFKVERSIQISQPKDSVYQYLKFLKNQDQFSVWTRKDPKMKKTDTGQDGIVGFVSAWESKDESVGTGSMELVKLTPGERIDMHLRFKVPFENEDDAYFETSSINAENTRVIWGFEGNTPYPWNALSYLLNFDEMIGKDLEGGLKKLKSVLEK